MGGCTFVTGEDLLLYGGWVDWTSVFGSGYQVSIRSVTCYVCVSRDAARIIEQTMVT